MQTVSPIFWRPSLGNPLDPDTDHDGMRDDVDPIPQASRTGPPPPDSEVLRMALETALGYDKKAIHTGGPATQEERTASVIDCRIHPVRTSTGSRTPTVMFVEADPALFTGIDVPQRIVILTPKQVEEKPNPLWIVLSNVVPRPVQSFTHGSARDLERKLGRRQHDVQ